MIKNRENIKPYVTKDGSTVRELYHPSSSPFTGASLAEASVERGGHTEAHVHWKSQEIYYILEGSGSMELGGDVFDVSPGDAILIKPGTPHSLEAGEDGLRLLCVCSPAYSHEDTTLV
jgi:mannose-6-phosphate isomerase-like protein (cupin superfamily)